MAYLRNPLVGDKIYHAQKELTDILPLEGEEAGRHYFLHAAKIAFKDFNGDKVEIESPVPPSLQHLFYKR